jgi:hypothetical protein
VFFADQFVDHLARLSQPRRQACLFALETRTTPDIVAELTWARVATMHQLPQLATELLRAASATRHIRLNYVFWEWATQKIAAPLLHLQWSVEKAFECPWHALVRKHADMVMIDRRADLSSFLGVAQEVKEGRL